MPTPPDESTILAWARLLRAQSAAMAEVEARLKAAGFPPLSWYDALLELERAGPHGLRPFALEHAMLVTQYNLSRLVDRLEAAGFVERKRCPVDGRGHMLVLTQCGKGLRRRMWPVYAAAIEEVIGARLDKGEAAELARLLAKLTPPPSDETCDGKAG